MSKRMTVIDALRGVAALAVILPHSVGFFESLESPSWPVRFFFSLSDMGHCGVDVFFVLSGFVIASSLSGALITWRFFLNFALRRSIRLDPPYWVAIALMFGYLFLRSLVSGQSSGYPPVMQTITHFFYLQDLLGWGDINPVFWTLCIEIQFYLAFCLSLALVSYFARLWPSWSRLLYGLVFGGFWSLSLAIRAGLIDLRLPSGLFPFFWYEFLLGAFIWWYLAKIISIRWVLIFTAIWIATALLGRLDSHSITAAVTACVILWFSWREQLFSGLSNPALQYFGRISYSLYLVHVPVVLTFMGIRTRLNADSALVSLALFAIAILASVFVAHCLHLLVERPSTELAKRLKFAPSTQLAKADMRAPFPCDSEVSPPKTGAFSVTLLVPNKAFGTASKKGTD